MWVFIIFLYVVARTIAMFEYLLLTNVNRTINKLWLKSCKFFLVNIYAYMYPLYVASIYRDDKIYRVFFTPPLNKEQITKIYDANNLKEIGYLTKDQFETLKSVNSRRCILINGISFNDVKML